MPEARARAGVDAADDTPRATVYGLAAIFAVALLVRLAWMLWTEPLPPVFSDAEYYDAAARSLARGHGYTVLLTDAGFLPGGDATAFFPPGFPAFLALAYAVFGESIGVARAANVLAGALTVLPVYFIGSGLFGRTSGIVAAAIAACLPSLVFWTPVLLSETFFALAFACALALVVRTQRGASLSRRDVLLAGGVIGLAALVRGQALVLLPAAAAWWWLSGVGPRQALLSAGLATAAAVLVLLPWTLRNAAEFDAPVLVSTNFGYNLRVGHAPYATGRFLDPSDLYDQPASGNVELELHLNRTGARRALDYALGNPGRELELSLDKVRWLWGPDSDVVLWLESFGLTPLDAGAIEPVRWAVIISHWLVLALVVAGVGLAWRSGRDGVVLAGLLCLAWTAVHVVFFGEPRYHIPLLPALLPLAALPLIEATSRLRARGPVPLT